MGIRLGQIAAAICLLNAGMARGGDDIPVAGVWRGESVCVAAGTSCHNETVVYYIEDVAKRPDLVTIRADKIVDGKAVTMGTSQFTHDRTRHILEWRTSERVWKLTIDGNRIEGTLTLADQTLFRKLTLRKDQ